MTHAEPAGSSAPRPSSPTATLFLIVVIDLIGFGIILPILPTYGAQFHVSDVAIGGLVGAFSLMQFLLAPWWGRVSDRIGRRPVLIIGLAGSTLSYLIFAFAGSFLVLLLSRLVAGGMGATVNVAQAYLADVTPPERRARAMGLIGAAFGLGFIVGPALAGLTIGFGEAVPGVVAAGFCFLSLVIALVRLPETRVHRPTTTRRLPILRRETALPYAVMFFYVLAFTVITVVFPLFVTRQLGYDRGSVAYFFVLMGSVSALTQGWLVGKIAPRFGERTLMSAGAITMATGLAAVPFCHQGPLPEALVLPAFLTALMLVAFGAALVSPTVAGYLSRIVDVDDQGRALGGLQSVGSMGRIIGPPAAGFLNEMGGAGMAFLGSTAMALVAAAAATRARRLDRD